MNVKIGPLLMTISAEWQSTNLRKRIASELSKHSSGGKIYAIKLYREIRPDSTLKEAFDYVTALIADKP